MFNFVSIYTALLLLLNLDSHAQKQAEHWVFGHQASFHFLANSSPLFNQSSVRQLEGTATISDPLTGQLLFYTDGMSVWNRTHQRMPEGKGLLGSSTSTQSALIVPFPGNAYRYYLFTIKSHEDGVNAGLHYSIVDMSLNNGLGEVTDKNILLESHTAEKLTAIPHANGQDYWVISHAWNSNEFLVYLLTSEGITNSQRIRIGIFHERGKVDDSGSMGYLKASPNGKYLASAVYGKNLAFEIFDFNDQTGDISNVKNLGSFSGQYGVSFSPDNTKLYLSGLYPHQGAYQFDLISKAVTPLRISHMLGTKKLEYYLAGALELAPDGKLYSSFTRPGSNGSSKLAVIEKPNELINEKAIVWHSLPLKGQGVHFGLPNFMQSYFNQEKLNRTEATELVNIYPNPVINKNLTIFVAHPDQISKLTIHNLQGNIVPEAEKIFEFDRLILNTSSWPSGHIYIIKFDYLGKLYSYRLIK